MNNIIKLHTKEIHRDVLKKLNRLNKPQRHLPDNLGIKRSTLFRMSKGRSITMETFLKLLNWLEVSPETYIKSKTGVYYKIYTNK